MLDISRSVQRRRRADDTVNQLRRPDELDSNRVSWPWHAREATKLLYTHLVEVAGRYAGADRALVRLNGLDDPSLRGVLWEQALYRSKHAHDLTTSNDLLTLVRAERFLSSGQPNVLDFREASRVIDPRLESLFRYSQVEHEIRQNDREQRLVELHDIAAKLKREGDFNGYYDVICRLADFEIIQGNADCGYSMLLGALKGLGVAGYSPNPNVRRIWQIGEKQHHLSQKAWIYRALSRARLAAARSDAPPVQRAIFLDQASLWNREAFLIYLKTAMRHGLGNVLRERGDIERAWADSETEANRLSQPFYEQAVGLFEFVGDEHHAAQARVNAVWLPDKHGGRGELDGAEFRAITHFITKNTASKRDSELEIDNIRRMREIRIREQRQDYRRIYTYSKSPRSRVTVQSLEYSGNSAPADDQNERREAYCLKVSEVIQRLANTLAAELPTVPSSAEWRPHAVKLAQVFSESPSSALLVAVNHARRHQKELGHEDVALYCLYVAEAALHEKREPIALATIHLLIAEQLGGMDEEESAIDYAGAAADIAVETRRPELARRALSVLTHEARPH